MKRHSPGICIWEITLKCNLKCLHCGSSAGIAKPDELTKEEGIKLIRDLSKIGFKGVALMGGEVFTRREWYDFSKEIKNNNMSLSIVTNGFWNVDDFVPILTKLETDCVTVGLDGFEKTHDKIRGVKGSFNKAVNFLKKCKEAEIPTNAITTAHKLNFKEIEAMADLVLEEIGVDWQLQEAVPIGRFDKNLKLDDEEYYSLGIFVSNLQNKYSKERVVGGHNFGFHSKLMGNLSLYPHWNGCYAGMSVLGIKQNGDVIGCLTLPDKYIEENIRNINIVDIWNNPNNFAYNRKFKPDDLGENCKGCEYDLSCKGGCMSRSVTMTGKSHNDPHCFYRYEQKN